MTDYYDPVNTELKDSELHDLLNKYDPNYKEKGKLTEGQRQIRIKRLNHYIANEEKERKAKEKKSKETTKSLNATFTGEIAKKNTPAKGRKRKSVATFGDLNTTFSTEASDGIRASVSSDNRDIQISPEKIPITPKKLAQTPVKVLHCVELEVFDSVDGVPAAGLYLELFGLDIDRSWKSLAQRTVNSEGSCPGLITRDLFERGVYKLVLNTGEYFEKRNATTVHRT